MAHGIVKHPTNHKPKTPPHTSVFKGGCKERGGDSVCIGLILFCIGLEQKKTEELFSPSVWDSFSAVP